MLRENISFEDTIRSFENDIKSFEDPVYKLRLLILFISDDNLINILEKKITMKNKYISNKEIIYHIQSTEELKDCKITYLLNFTIEKSMQELYDLLNNTNASPTTEKDYYNLNTITNLKTLNIDQDQNQTAFIGINSLIIIANKKNNCYIKSKNNLGRKNVSKKRHKS